MFKTFLFVAAAVALASAAPADKEQEVQRAVARLDGNGVSGIITFTRKDDGKLISVTGTVTGMPAGEYGLTVYETGDLSNGCNSTGGHFNPHGTDHGHPHDDDSHVGDLGNIKFDNTKTAKVDFHNHKIKLNGEHNIIGRALVLHAGRDDLGHTDHPESSVTGNAGARVACGVIGIA